MNLSANQIDHDAASSIAKALEVNQTITTIDLSVNHIEASDASSNW